MIDIIFSDCTCKFTDFLPNEILQVACLKYIKLKEYFMSEVYEVGIYSAGFVSWICEAREYSAGFLPQLFEIGESSVVFMSRYIRLGNNCPDREGFFPLAISSSYKFI
jgi:hypothetical protein